MTMAERMERVVGPIRAYFDGLSDRERTMMMALSGVAIAVFVILPMYLVLDGVAMREEENRQLIALSAIARKALERKTGARGLRSILEQVLLDTMYELPGMDNVTKVVIDENTITGDNRPLLIYAEQPKVSGSN